ncbi:penicillin-binding transpeptidase domain-containing protein [Limosilactobacillus sp.]|jgi:penicillin-binding protein 2B|uniref:penicillin-binding transpeptidase domain-containing protein n=1 Tax=Limosilactobacillus sp. TaxID=2773925 RepID=UPI0025B9BA52|nr:penicillin-binding transpeptidase domain-containing protein [Limosilactobacillus sp.]MCH3922498.1 penicillin-binding protein [Limosilactobacillus sp.]MCH3927180.1 penicillin-binding protein [Limosilactobacillus sp.]
MNKEPERARNKRNNRNQGTFGKWLFLITVSLFALFIVRFAYIAINKDVQHVNLRSKAEQTYTQRQVIQARRGTIYDSEGNKLATDTSRYTLYAIVDHHQRSNSGKPLYVTNKKKTARILARYIDEPASKIKKTLTTDGQTYQVEFGTAGSNLSVATMQKIKSYHLPGINFVATPARQYPEGEFASQLIGMANPKTEDNGTTKLVGQLGLEGYFNKQLTGTNGIRQDKQDVYGYRLANSKGTVKPAVNGDDVHTTIDPQTQHLIETKVNKVFKASKANAMTAVVMEAKTGKIIAATQRPTLRSKKNPVWRNMLAQDAYEPGSTMKVLALSAAIDSGHFNPNDTFNSGTWSLGGGKITDWSSSGWGAITYKDAFDLSSNVGFAHVEQNMGADTWYKYIKRFGLLKKVNVDGMGSEVNGYTQFKGALEQANTAFGQGITVNELQMMQAFSAVANRGKMMKPYFVSKVVNSKGKTVKSNHPKQVGKPIKAKTAKQVLGYMEGVVYDEKGLGHMYQIKGHRIAAKTGTAQIGGANGYSKGDTNYLYSMVGMAPAKHPRYIIYITLRQPQNISTPAANQIAEVFNPTMKMLLNRQSTTKSAKHSMVNVPNLVGQSSQQATTKLGQKHLQAVVLGSGKTIRKQSIPAGQQALINQRVILTTGGTVQLPDMSGWSSADVEQLAAMLHLKLKEEGSGYLVSQSIAANTQVKAQTTLTVKYKPKE